MNTKLRALGLGLLAVTAMTAFGVMNATAETGGHFTHDAPTNHATIVGTETAGTEHVLHFNKEGGEPGERIGCDKDEYHGVATAKTVESLTITPKWSECYTTGSPNTKFDIHENGCDFTFTIGREGQVAKHHTVHLTCPAGKAVEITHPNCTITVPPQTVTGVTYTTDLIGGKHAITLDVTAEDITSHYHAGICIFLGTTHQSEMKGSVTVEGFDTLGNRVNITATTGPKL